MLAGAGVIVSCGVLIGESHILWLVNLRLNVNCVARNVKWAIRRVAVKIEC